MSAYGQAPMTFPAPLAALFCQATQDMPDTKCTVKVAAAAAFT